jgi:hypothetical protein
MELGAILEERDRQLEEWTSTVHNTVTEVVDGTLPLPTGSFDDPIAATAIQWVWPFSVETYLSVWGVGWDTSGLPPTIQSSGNQLLSIYAAPDGDAVVDGKISGPLRNTRLPTAGDRILMWVETEPYSGIFTVDQVGSVSTPWILTLAPPTDGSPGSLDETLWYRWPLDLAPDVRIVGRAPQGWDSGFWTVSSSSPGTVVSGNAFAVLLPADYDNGGETPFTVAMGDGAFAARGGMALGPRATAGPFGVALGDTAYAADVASTALGTNSRSLGPRTVLGAEGTPAVQFLAYAALTANYTLTDQEHTVDCTTGSFTVTLPTAVGATGRIYVVKNSGAGSITVDTTSSQTIDGLTSQTVTPGSAMMVQSTGTDWIII